MWMILELEKKKEVWLISVKIRIKKTTTDDEL